MMFTSRLVRFFSTYICVGLALFFPLLSEAAPRELVYQGRILRPDGSPLEGNIDFLVKIYSPAPSKCLLWAERQTLSMQGSMGAFSLDIGKPGHRLNGAEAGGATSFGQVFINHPGLTINSPQCSPGFTGYTPSSTDERTISVSFSDAGREIRVVDLPIKSVPFAMQAEQISGYSVNSLFKIAGVAQPGDKPSSLFAKDGVDLLWEIAHNQDFLGKPLKNLGEPVVNSDAATKNYVDSLISQGSLGVGITDVTGDANILVAASGTTRALSLGTTGVTAGVYGAVGPSGGPTGVSVPVLTVDMWGRITSASQEPMPLATTGGGFGLITVDASSGLTLSGGTLGLNLSGLSGSNFGAQAQNVVLAGPLSGGTGAVSFRALDEIDIPQLASTGKVQNSATSATPALTNDAIIARDAVGGFKASGAFLNYLALDNGLQAGTSSAILLSAPMGSNSYSLVFPGTAPQNGDLLSFDSSGQMSWVQPGTAGLTSLEMIVPTAEMNVSSLVGPGDGTLSLSWKNQNAGLVFAAPTGASGQPSFRQLAASDIATGTFGLAQIPDLDATKITSGTFDLARIPDLSAAKITAGTFDLARIPDLDAAKITSGTLPVSRGGTGLIPQVSDANRLYGVNAAGDNSEFKTLVGGSGVTITHNTGSLTFSFDSSAVGVVTNVGLTAPTSVFSVTGSDVTGAGTLGLSFLAQNAAMVFAAPTGSAGIPSFRQLEASDIASGTFNLAQIPDLDASKITSGTFDLARIPDLDAAKITAGTFDLARIPDLDASKITAGTFDLARIPDLDAAKIISGTLDIARIPDLNAARITSGTFDLARIPDLDTTKITSGTFDLARIPDLNASKITAGSFDLAQIPDLNAAKITSGTLPVSRGGTGLVPQVSDANRLYGVNAAGTGSEFKTLFAGSGITISNATGSINISAPGSGTLGWAQGGNSFGQTGTLGTNDNQDLALQTNGSIRMSITAGGSVGVGTTSPSAVFNVVGTATFTGGDVLFGPSALGTRVGTSPPTGADLNVGSYGVLTTGVFNSNKSGSSTTAIGNANLAGGGGSGWWWLQTDDFNGLRVATHNSGTPLAVITVQQAGNVGIGTTSPSSPLSVTAPTGFTAGTLASITAPTTTLTSNMTGLSVGMSAVTPSSRNVTGISIPAFTGGSNSTSNRGLYIGNINGSGSSMNTSIHVDTATGAGAWGGTALLLTGGNSAKNDFAIAADSPAQSYFMGKVGIGVNRPTNPLSASPLQYSAGTASQSGTSVTGTGTSWTNAMVGSQFIFPHGWRHGGESSGTITAVNSATSLTVTVSRTVSEQAYTIHYPGLNVKDSGLVGIGTTNPTSMLQIDRTSYYSPGLTINFGDTFGGGGLPLTMVQTQGSGGGAYATLSRGDTAEDGHFIYTTTGVANTDATPSWSTGISKEMGVGPAYDYAIREYGSSVNTRFVIKRGGNVGIGVTAPTTALQVAGVISPSADNTHDLGTATLRFKNIYAANATIQTSDLRQKKDVEDSDLGLDFIGKLRPVSFKWRTGSDTERHYGLIAQNIETAIHESQTQARRSSSDSPGIVTQDPGSGRYGVRYTELISPIIRALQELYAKWVSHDRDIASLEARNEKLEQENQAIKTYLCAKDPTAPFCE